VNQTKDGLGPQIEAEYELETAVKCPHCASSVASLLVVRMLRARVNFTSTLPRRGQVLICPQCRAIVSGEVSGLL
jgi:hypothetical protein